MLIESTGENTLLYGKDQEEYIVGIHQQSDCTVRVYTRKDNKVLSRDEPFYPFFFLSEEELLKDFVPERSEKYWLIPLSGRNYYKYLAIFRSWSNYRNAADHIQKKITDQNTENPGIPAKNHLVYNRGDAITQYLMQTGKTLFKGMVFEDLHRMQLDIETYFRPEKDIKSKVEIGKDPVIIISLSDNRGWEQILDARECTEKELLEQLVKVVQTKNPDVIEGHNIFGFDLPYLHRRCELNDVEFRLGRDGSIPRTYPASIRFAERSIDYTYYEINGRHVIDTFFLVQSYDVSQRALPGYGLKVAAQHFGVAAPGRTYVEYNEIAELWESNPQRLLDYALDDVRETRALSSLLSGSNFYLTQMMPYTYAQTSRTGPAAKIEALLVREYVRNKHALPRPESGEQHAGGYTEVFLQGILGPVVYADVESLYPSIMLAYNICPKSDQLRIFPQILKDLKDLRFKAKHASKDHQKQGNALLADNLDAMQASFKIVINAMYGYLGFGSGIFNDYGEADRVTTTGQQIAKQMIREFEARGSRIIEVDTDGILFIPPVHITTEEEERNLVKEVSDVMPEGITIGYDGRFRKMISYLKKNYALLAYDGSMKLKGSSLVSRSGEKFGREFIREGFARLLEEDIQGLHDLYVSWKNRILNHEWSIADFSRTESMKSSLAQYREDVENGKRTRSITYEIAIRKGIDVCKGDRITYYVSGSGLQSNHYEKGRTSDEWPADAPDENTQFYIKRLDEYCQKFLPFFKPQDFSALFSTDTLFSFSPEGIEIIKEIRNRETGEESLR
jgi:DNA polymerase, archaea type